MKRYQKIDDKGWEFLKSMKESSTLYHTIICWLILEWWVEKENEQEEKYYEDLMNEKRYNGITFE